jgi:hypothetical protein
VTGVVLTPEHLRLLRDQQDKDGLAGLPYLDLDYVWRAEGYEQVPRWPDEPQGESS